jgi:hypothetical protein
VRFGSLDQYLQSGNVIVRRLAGNSNGG